MYGAVNELINKVYFYILFLRVNLTFFPIHQIGIIGIPRRYFAYGEVFHNINMITYLGTLLTLVSWLVLMSLVYDTQFISISGHGKLGGETMYRNNLPYHTYMESNAGNYGLRGHVQHLCDMSP